MCWGLEGKAGGKEAERGREGMPGSRRDSQGAGGGGLACALGRGREPSPETAGGGGGRQVCLCVCSHAVMVFAFVPLGSRTKAELDSCCLPRNWRRPVGGGTVSCPAA